MTQDYNSVNGCPKMVIKTFQFTQEYCLSTEFERIKKVVRKSVLNEKET